MFRCVSFRFDLLVCFVWIRVVALCCGVLRVMRCCSVVWCGVDGCGLLCFVLCCCEVLCYGVLLLCGVYSLWLSDIAFVLCALF